MSTDVDEKRELLAKLLGKLEDDYRTLLAAQKATHEGATHEEARPENDKDTRALEQSYLARGQAERVAELKSDIATLSQLAPRAFEESSTVALGAFVSTEDEHGALHHYLLAPAGAGAVFACSLGDVKVVTPRSPLGRALLSCHVGDEIEVRSPTGKRALTIAGLY